MRLRSAKAGEVQAGFSTDALHSAGFVTSVATRLSRLFEVSTLFVRAWSQESMQSRRLIH